MTQILLRMALNIITLTLYRYFLLLYTKGEQQRIWCIVYKYLSEILSISVVS
jgi:hypothetical protein